MSWRFRLINPSGGLAYHFLGWRRSQSSWIPLKRSVDLFLREWSPRSQKLLLIGPSAGYTLTRSFLSRFEQIDALDPDPLAAFLFRLRFPALPLTWHLQDYFTSKGQIRQDTFEQLDQQFPDHAILFSNFLGQLPLLVELPDAHWPRSWHQNFQAWLSEKEWASYHDLISTTTHPTPEVLHQALQSNELSTSKLAQMLFSDTNHAIEITDHLTESLFSFCPTRRQRWAWPLSSSQFHVIEGVCQPSPETQGSRTDPRI